MSPKASVSSLGTGLMGRKMAVRLVQQGHPVTAWNRDPAKSALLAPHGCHVAQTAADAVQRSQVVLLMLADAAAIHQVLLEDAATRATLPGKSVLMMSTIGPSESKQLAGELAAAGVELYVEAPVLGSQPEAEAGTLQIMAACDSDPTTSTAWPVLRALGQEPRLLGRVGSAAAVKLALNQLIAAETLAFCSSLGLVQRSGADVAHFMDILRGSALYAPTFDKKLAKYLSRDFGTANFPTKFAAFLLPRCSQHLLKDVRLFCNEAESQGLATSMQRATEALCIETCARTQEGSSAGLRLADADYSAVYEAAVFPQRPTQAAP
ncbi:3-hydroxyacid dehydrogenase [Haematococcus lacustris]